MSTLYPGAMLIKYPHVKLGIFLEQMINKFANIEGMITVKTDHKLLFSQFKVKTKSSYSNWDKLSRGFLYKCLKF